MPQAEYFHSRGLQITAGPPEVDASGEHRRMFKVILDHQAPVFHDTADGVRASLLAGGHEPTELVFDWLYAMEDFGHGIDED